MISLSVLDLQRVLLVVTMVTLIILSVLISFLGLEFSGAILCGCCHGNITDLFVGCVHCSLAQVKSSHIAVALNSVQYIVRMYILGCTGSTCISPTLPLLCTFCLP